MKFGNFVFRPGLWPTLAAGFFLVLTLYLGNWQLSRAEYKQSLQARYDHMQRDGEVLLQASSDQVDELLYRAAEVRGQFVTGGEIFIDNRVYQTRAGYHVLTPFRIAGSDTHVLVNRGWVVVQDRRRDVLPNVPAIEGEIRLRGIVVAAQSRYYELDGAAPQGKLWQNLNFERYRQQFGHPLLPLMLQQTSDTQDGLVRDWVRPDTGVGTHISYAIQWFGLAATLVVLWLGLNIKRIKTSESM